MFNPMWDNETERVAWEKCSLMAARLRDWADIFSLLAIAYVIAAIYLHQSAWLALLIWLFGRGLFYVSVKMILARDFCYDGEKIEARWRDEAGNECVYTHDDYQRDAGYL